MRISKIFAAAMIGSTMLAAPAVAQVVIEQGTTVQVAPAQPAPVVEVIPVERVGEVREVFVEAAPEPVAVDFTVTTGAVVPDTVTLQPLPPRIVEIVPQYDGYQYVAVEGGSYAIVEPSTSEVVYVID
jgi:hypothetical protein